MHKILFIEDSVEVQIVVRSTLATRYEVTIVGQLSEASALIQKNAYDLMIIDVGLPDGDGFQFCAQLKNDEKTANIPVIILTARGDIKDKLMGFALGADDYLVKPFEPLELRARVEAKLKAAKNKYLETVHKGDIKLSIPFQKAFVQDRDIDLSPNEFKLLYHFVTHEGFVLSRTQLLDSVWGINVNVSDRTVDAHVYSLRKKLGVVASSIESVFGSGYRFVGQRSPFQSL